MAGVGRAAGRRLRPGDRRGQRRRSTSRGIAEVDEAVAAADDGLPRLAGRPRSPSAPRCCSPSASCSTPARDELAAIIVAEHGKVHSDALGEVARGLEVVEFACGIPQLLKGGFTEQASTGVDVYSIRQPLGPVAIISPFNFPAMVPMWFFPIAIAAGNTVVVKPSEKDPSAANFLAELWSEAGLPDGVFNVVHGDKVAVDRLLEHPDVKARLLRRLHPDRPLRLRDRHPLRQARPGARRRQEPHAGPARRRPRPGRRRRGQRRLRRRGRALHGGLRAGRGRPDRRRAGRARSSRADGQPDASAPAARPTPRWARWSPACTATRSPPTSTPGVADGADPGGRRPRAPDRPARTPPTASGSARPCSTTSRPSMSIYTDEIFGPVLSVVRVASYDEALRADQRQPVRQRHRDLHQRRRRGPALPARGRGRHGRHQRADPGAGRLLLLRRLEGLAVRRHPRLRHRRRALLHPRQGRHPALARPQPRRHQPRLPHQRRDADGTVPSSTQHRHQLATTSEGQW